jgi:hypothetical protein
MNRMNRINQSEFRMNPPKGKMEDRRINRRRESITISNNFLIKKIIQYIGKALQYRFLNHIQVQHDKVP